MKHWAMTVLAVTMAATPALAQDDVEARVAASRAAAKDLMSSLVKTMEAAVKEGGPLNAIQVCNTKAQVISKEASERAGWRIGRTSLKVRNPKNAPDAWEKGVLEEFAKRKAAGESLDDMEYYAVVEQDGQKQFRYMKAIGLRGVCVVCHGDPIRKDVSDKLYELYPKDQARGFLPGDLRGAFTVIQPM